ncbi:MAG: DUF732 domain-containing protein [Mycobacterium sp.]|nr:MAG: DUF732 domain-containing protein [Mycobacterium sp.]
MGLDEVEPTEAAELLPTTELDPAATAAAGPLAYSDHTTSMPVVDYRPPPRTGWILALVLATAGAVAAAMFVLGRSTAPEVAAPPPAEVSSSSMPPPAATPAPVAASPPDPVSTPPEPAAASADQIFLRALDENGSVTNADAAIRMGHQLCDALSRNSTQSVANALQGAHPDLSADAISVYINAAKAAYCPTVQ